MTTPQTLTSTHNTNRGPILQSASHTQICSHPQLSSGNDSQEKWWRGHAQSFQVDTATRPAETQRLPVQAETLSPAAFPKHGMSCAIPNPSWQSLDAYSLNKN
jgi:hypothetical protein